MPVIYGSGVKARSSSSVMTMVSAPPLSLRLMEMVAASMPIAGTWRHSAQQIAFNEEHGITPETVKKNVEDVLEEQISRFYYCLSFRKGAR